jgi:hypothetical protein
MMAARARIARQMTSTDQRLAQKAFFNNIDPERSLAESKFRTAASP